MIEKVPIEFQIPTNHIYPKYNTTIFEEYFFNNYKDITTNYTYLPILFQSYYYTKQNNLQQYLNNLNTNKKYFTIVQNDDGIKENIDHLDILVFGQCGGSIKTTNNKNIGYPIPLNCMPSKYTYKEKDLLFSFIGSITGRHKIRERIKKLYSNDYIISESSNYEDFIDTMERSTFSLCPRGYGKSSYRICESLQHNSIPVYISDNFWLPFNDKFNFEDIGILIQENQLEDLSSIIKDKSIKDITNYIDNGKSIYNEYFTYEGCMKNIIEIIKK